MNFGQAQEVHSLITLDFSKESHVSGVSKHFTYLYLDGHKLISADSNCSTHPKDDEEEKNTLYYVQHAGIKRLDTVSKAQNL